MQPSSTVIVLSILTTALIIVTYVLIYRLRKSKNETNVLKQNLIDKDVEYQDIAKNLTETNERYKPIIDVEKHIAEKQIACDTEINSRKAIADGDYQKLLLETGEKMEALKELNTKYVTAHELFKRLEETVY